MTFALAHTLTSSTSLHRAVIKKKNKIKREKEGRVCMKKSQSVCKMKLFYRKVRYLNYLLYVDVILCAGVKQIQSFFFSKILSQLFYHFKLSIVVTFVANCPWEIIGLCFLLNK